MKNKEKPKQVSYWLGYIVGKVIGKIKRWYEDKDIDGNLYRGYWDGR